MAEERAKFQEADADKDLSGLWRVSGFWRLEFVDFCRDNPCVIPTKPSQSLLYRAPATTLVGPRGVLQSSSGVRLLRTQAAVNVSLY